MPKIKDVNDNQPVYFSCMSKVCIGCSISLGITAVVLGILGLQNKLPHGLPKINTLQSRGLIGGGSMFTTVPLAFIIRSFFSEKRLMRETDTDDELQNQSVNNSQNNTTKKTTKNPEVPKVLPIFPTDTSAEDVLSVLSTLAWKDQKVVALFKEQELFPGSEAAQPLLQQHQHKEKKELYHAIAKAFIENAPLLTEFLDAQTKKLLTTPTTNDDKEDFKRITQQVRVILFFFLSYEKLDQQTIQYYHDSRIFNDERDGSLHFKHPINYFRKLCEGNLNQTKPLVGNFLCSFTLYRRHALLRLFPEKIREKLPQAELPPLLLGTWFHGTGSLTSLAPLGGDFILAPTGALMQANRISFFGEMRDGAKSCGINATSLSGTALIGIDRTFHYATDFLFSMEKTKNVIQKFLNHKMSNDLPSFCNYANFLPEVVMAIKRWALWDQGEFTKQIPALLQKLQAFHNKIQQLEQQRPKELFENEDYLLPRYHSLCDSIKQIDIFLKNPLPSILNAEQREAIQKSFPTVLGSSTLFAKPVNYLDKGNEHVIRESAEVGKDIQFLCVQDEDIEKANAWVEQHRRDCRMQVFSFTQLSEAQHLCSQIEPFLIDIFSEEKLKRFISPNI